VVPKPKHLETIGPQTLVPFPIFFGPFRMLTAIQFDDNSFIKTYEVNDESFDRFLSSEFYPFELTRFQTLPQKPLGIGWVIPKSLGVIGEQNTRFVHIRCFTHPLTPSRQGRGDPG
jgi:hypothetical protein